MGKLTWAASASQHCVAKRNIWSNVSSASSQEWRCACVEGSPGLVELFEVSHTPALPCNGARWLRPPLRVDFVSGKSKSKLIRVLAGRQSEWKFVIQPLNGATRKITIANSQPKSASSIGIRCVGDVWRLSIPCTAPLHRSVPNRIAATIPACSCAL